MDVLFNSGFSGTILTDIDYLRSFLTENVNVHVDFTNTTPKSKYEGPANIFWSSGPDNN